MPDPSPVFVIAEAGVNHNGDRDLALRLVDVAAQAGADAVKFQTFDAARLASRHVPKAGYQQRTTDAGESQRDMLARLELQRDWHGELKQHANAQGLEFLSTPFDEDSLDFLLELGMPRLKLPSGELTNAPLLWRFARARLPLIVSTGMATLSEVEQALAVIAHARHHDQEPTGMQEVWRHWGRGTAICTLVESVVLLHCTSQYPTPMEQANLRAMDTLGHAFGLPVGYSDHTEGCLIPVAAVARGATVIEKHFTLDRSMPGPDHRASLEPQELIRMVAEVRALECALGHGRKAPQESEWDTRIAARQQVVATRDLSAGHRLERLDLGTARCGAGIPADQLWSLIGSTLGRAHAVGEPIER